MKPIEYREIDNPASLLKKLNWFIEVMNSEHLANGAAFGGMRIKLDELHQAIRAEITTAVAELENRIEQRFATHSLAGHKSSDAPNRAQAPTKDDTNINTK